MMLDAIADNVHIVVLGESDFYNAPETGCWCAVDALFIPIQLKKSFHTFELWVCIAPCLAKDAVIYFYDTEAYKLTDWA